MTTYNTYQEAKIANPESDIYTNAVNDKFQSRSDETFFVRCLPKNNCMTYNQCDEFKAGMVVMDLSGIKEINEEEAAFLNEVKGYHTNKSNWDECFILRAATLEEKKPRTKVEYEQIGFHKCHEAMFKHEMEEKLYIGCNGGFELATHVDIADNWNYNLYRRIETPMTERDEFIEAACEVNERVHGERRQYIVESLFDSGKFKLVN